MLIEAFTKGKWADREELNEDRLVIRPNQLLAVVDGATSRTATRYGGSSSGLLAAKLLQGALGAYSPGDPVDLVEHLSSTISSAYARLGLQQIVQRQIDERFCASVATVRLTDQVAEVVVVGDCSVRLNETEIFCSRKLLDNVIANLRCAAWALVDLPEGERHRLCRNLALGGLASSHYFSEPAARQLHEVATSMSVSELPGSSSDEVAWIVWNGLSAAAARYQNRENSMFSFACIDGSPVPATKIITAKRPRPEIQTIELFSDGYFSVSAEFGVDAWENQFAYAELRDPAKTGLFKSTKGSYDGNYADDRSYIGIRF